MAAALLAAANFVFAQVEVEDRTIDNSPSNAPYSPAATVEPAPAAPASTAVSGGGNNIAELFYQMQVMQQEILELRGLVEQQTHQIKQLKQQRLDDYVDLDRRISALGQSGAAVSAPGPSSTAPVASSAANSAAATAASSATVVGVASSPASEMAHYKSATKLVLVDKNYDEGIARLKEHLELYPKGRYAGNAEYWLGEVYLAEGDLESSRQWFERLMQDFPLHAKVPDAKYKLGTVYHQLGMDTQAQQILQEVSMSSGNAAKLAKDYLKQNFNG